MEIFNYNLQNIIYMYLHMLVCHLNNFSFLYYTDKNNGRVHHKTRFY